MNVTGKIRRYLEKKGFVQKEIAERANIPYSAFNAMMTGRRKMYAEELRAVCFALNVKPEMFM